VNDEATILITGSSRGLGRALAELYADRGITVFGCSRNDTEFSHENYHHMTADISKEDDVKDMFFELSKFRIRPRVLINNAGTKRDSVALLATLEQAQDMMSSNFFGPFLVTREASKLMKRARFGRIVNISSIAVPLADIGSGLYAATKAATEQFSHALSREFAHDNITVNTLGISIFEDSAMLENLDPEVLKRANNILTKPSPLTVHEISHAIDFFTHQNAGNITAQTVYFGGIR